MPLHAVSSDAHSVPQLTVLSEHVPPFRHRLGWQPIFVEQVAPVNPRGHVMVVVPVDVAIRIDEVALDAVVAVNGVEEVGLVDVVDVVEVVDVLVVVVVTTLPHVTDRRASCRERV